MVECVLIGLLLIALGAFFLIRPDLAWKLQEQWKSYNADGPSDLYVILIRISGGVLILMGLIMIVLPFVLQ